MSEIRALTVRQPWAWAIIHGGKDVENRSRNIVGSYRGPVLIHAAQRYDKVGYRDLHRDPTSLLARAWKRFATQANSIGDNDFGALIGVVDIVGVHWGEREGVVDMTPMCSRWAYGPGDPSWHMRLANPRPLSNPVPYKGRLGLWRIDTADVPGLEALL